MALDSATSHTGPVVKLVKHTTCILFLAATKKFKESALFNSRYSKMNAVHLQYTRPADHPLVLPQPDLEVSTLAELRGAGRTLMVHAQVVARISAKVQGLINAAAPGAPVKLARDFTYETLEQALELVYNGQLVVTRVEAMDLDDIFCVWRADMKLHEIPGPQPVAED